MTLFASDMQIQTAPVLKKALHLGEIIGFQQRGQEVQKRLLPRLFAFQSIDNYF